MRLTGSFRLPACLLDRSGSGTYNRGTQKGWGRGGIGRRAGLKNPFPKGSVGSIPTIPTIFIFFGLFSLIHREVCACGDFNEGVDTSKSLFLRASIYLICSMVTSSPCCIAEALIIFASWPHFPISLLGRRLSILVIDRQGLRCSTISRIDVPMLSRLPGWRASRLMS